MKLLSIIHGKIHSLCFTFQLKPFLFLPLPKFTLLEIEIYFFVKLQGVPNPKQLREHNSEAACSFSCMQSVEVTIGPGTCFTEQPGNPAGRYWTCLKELCRIVAPYFKPVVTQTETL